MLKLSLRLKTVFEMVPMGSVVADIGSDHGKLIISLFEQYIELSMQVAQQTQTPIDFSDEFICFVFLNHVKKVNGLYETHF